MPSDGDTDCPHEQRPSSRETFDASHSGAQDHPFIPRLRSDPVIVRPLPPHNLVEFREQEGKIVREQRLQEVWLKLPKRLYHDVDDEEVANRYPVRRDGQLTRESAKELEEMYEDELVGKCNGHSGIRRRNIGWKEFKQYAVEKEAGAY